MRKSAREAGKMPFISFIVPVYNIRKYLRACVESVISQPLKDWEMILVDDASNDDSGDLCARFAAEDSRIKVLHNITNKGPGGARNTGIAYSSGDYLFFLDADDSITVGKLSMLWESMRKCGFPDIMLAGHCESFGWAVPGRKIEHRDAHETVSSVDDFLKPFIGVSTLGFYVWQFIIKREMLNDRAILFRSAKIGEDIDFTLRCLFSAGTVGTFGGVFYNYRTRLSGSLSLTSGHIRHWEHIVNSAGILLEFAHQDSISIIRKDWVYHNVNFLLNQFEAIAGAVPLNDINKQFELFLPFEKNMQVLRRFINNNGLLRHIQEMGAHKGPAVFCKNRAENVKRLLFGREERDIFGFPATRKCSRLLGLLNANGFQVKGMLDNDTQKQGLMLDGQTILSPEIIPQCYDDDNKLFIIISTATSSTGIVLAEQLRGYGLEEGRHFIFAGTEFV